MSNDYNAEQTVKLMLDAAKALIEHAEATARLLDVEHRFNIEIDESYSRKTISWYSSDC